ncbi:50S ribosomal protein L24 [Patescibacteria group bacterium]
MKIKKGDTVQILLGKDRGKQGKVERVYKQKREALVTGVNVFKKHVKPQGEGKPGGIVQINKPLGVSKLALICPRCQRPTRVGFVKQANKAKERICRKCQQTI